MNSRNLILVFIFMLGSMLAETKLGFGQVTQCFNIEINSSNILKNNSQINVAENDTFIYINSCNNGVLTGSVISNDQIKSNDSLKICYIYAPKKGILSFGSNGQFTYSADTNFEGEVNFRYRLCHISNHLDYTEAKVLIVVKKDNDCDEITNEIDLDNDNDGILNIHEGDGLIDTDMDNIPDNFDIDSDNDGITDIVEWQKEDSYLTPSGIDSNNDGWDDTFDPAFGGIYYTQTDTDLDQVPDYIDTDSDDDGISDFIEAYKTESEVEISIQPLYVDMDLDGLDDAFDTIPDWTNQNNSFGCNSPLPDFNNNGIRNWREDNNIYINPVTADELFLYPNPAINKISVHVPNSFEDQEINLYIYTISGKLLLAQKINSINNVVNIPGYKSGIFVVKYKTDSFTQTEKLILGQ